MRLETEKDLTAEQQAIDKACKYFGTSPSKMAKWDVDYILHKNGKAVGFAEVKCRKISIAKYKTIILSLMKLQRLVECNRFLKTVLVIQFTDALAYIELEKITGNVKFRGRKQRAVAPNDQEWVIEIPTESFALIS